MKLTHTFILASLLSGLGFYGANSAETTPTVSKYISARTKLTLIDKAINIYALEHNGKLPDSLNVLAESNDADWHPVLKKEDLVDPWGERIGYEHEECNYVIMSSGPDKKMGTADDILEGDVEAYQRGWKPKQNPPVDGQGTDAVQAVTPEQKNLSDWTEEDRAKEREEVMRVLQRAEEVRLSVLRTLAIGGITLIFCLCAVLYFLLRKLKTRNGKR
jgi:hypothetical protein